MPDITMCLNEDCPLARWSEPNAIRNHCSGKTMPDDDGGTL